MEANKDLIRVQLASNYQVVELFLTEEELDFKCQKLLAAVEVVNRLGEIVKVTVPGKPAEKKVDPNKVTDKQRKVLEGFGYKAGKIDRMNKEQARQAIKQLIEQQTREREEAEDEDFF